MSSNRRDGGPRLGLRAGLALALLLGFYVLALALMAALFGFFAVVALAIGAGDLPPGSALLAGLAVGCGFAVVGGVLQSVRVVTAEIPAGIAVRPADQPRLWEAVRDLAAEVGAPAPDEIRLVPGVNAFVTQETRLLGLVKGKVILGVGLGLLSVVDRAGLRAVLAHEFGHISGGDTRLGPMIHRAGTAIQRTVEYLERDERFFKKGVAQVFRAYHRLFRRTTTAVSRAQERAADRASVRVAGAPAAVRALETIGVAAPAFGFFADRYVVPAWERGRWPEDMYGGFRAFYADPGRREEFDQAREVVLAAETGRADSHPSIGDRIRLITAMDEPRPGPGPAGEEEPAWGLLTGRAEAEMALFAARTATGADGLKPITWERAADEVFGKLAAGAARTVGSAAIAIGGSWDRGGPDQVLALLAAGRGAELAEHLDASGDGEMFYPVRAVLAAEIVERHGGHWAVSWSGPTAVHWPGTPLDELVRLALEGPQGLAAVRAELGLPDAPLRELPPLSREAVDA
ncbi:M48 family metallopeptidase [Actinomadura rugatobispora]|uniref:M48 family metallopeptidase n=1 Tax=Actinomadura rugatobispora TaxID=1994 RepID=A0ABW1A1T9_9ACTN|nr:hypothetical protein GCM10010200_055260 [Actinomadura rugatobispora]